MWWTQPLLRENRPHKGRWHRVGGFGSRMWVCSLFSGTHAGGVPAGHMFLPLFGVFGFLGGFFPAKSASAGTCFASFPGFFRQPRREPADRPHRFRHSREKPARGPTGPERRSKRQTGFLLVPIGPSPGPGVAPRCVCDLNSGAEWWYDLEVGASPVARRRACRWLRCVMRWRGPVLSRGRFEA